MAKNLERIRGFVLDMDGTFYLGDRLLDGSLKFIDVLRGQGKEFIFLTNNSSRSAADYAAKIARLGLPIGPDKVLTSGEATALWLCDHYPDARLFVAGTPALEQEFTSHNLKIDQLQPDVVVLGFDTTMTYDKMWRLCDRVREGLPYIATHPDFNCPTEDGFMPDIGAMIAFVQASTGRKPDVVIGKPNRLIIEAASRKLGLPVEELAMIGDRLYTDIALGQTSGITTVLVLCGETGRGDLAASLFQPDYVFDNLGGVAEYLISYDSR